jgi:riboflavin biosynthesis pyrimidine reductase
MNDNDPVLQLYPGPSIERPLAGLYLAHDLRSQEAERGHPFVYSNFITSLDGRIAVPHPTRPGLTVPKSTDNERDWRLFQELATQADLIISSGRYLRDWAEGRAQEILQIDDPRFADLRAWRSERGLPPQPDIAIVSASMRFPIPDVLTAGGRKVVVFTTSQPDPARVAEVEALAGQVIVAGDEHSVKGEQMVRRMGELGYRTIYSAAGPQILHLLLTGDVLDRLYLTSASRVLGGAPFAAVVEGGLLEPAVDMTLAGLYYDRRGAHGLSQLFAAYDRAD